MYSEHPIFIDPEEENLFLWRFIDFTKFVSILLKKALFFCKANSLGDSWEGSYPKKEIDYFPRMFEDTYKNKDDKISEKVSNHIDDINIGIENQKNINLVSCWHYNETESAAMWKLYLKNEEGIVIKSSFKKFKESFVDTLTDVFIGKVHYINYNTDTFFYPPGNYSNPHFNFFRSFIHKRKSYSHENEYRAICAFDTDKSKSYERNNKGLYVPVNLDILIEEIIVSPNSPDWFFELVKEILKVYNISKIVNKSTLDLEHFK